MSKVRVQCKGSGRKVSAGVNAKRASCPWCHRQQDLTGKGRIRKHMVLTTTAKMRRGA